MSKPRAFGSFGRPEDPEAPDPDVFASRADMPTPNVGEFYAELRLVITRETLSELGSQIASMVSEAARQGFEHGMAAAMGELAGDDGDGELLVGEAPIPGVSAADIARASGESA